MDSKIKVVFEINSTDSVENIINVLGLNSDEYLSDYIIKENSDDHKIIESTILSDNILSKSVVEKIIYDYQDYLQSNRSKFDRIKVKYIANCTEFYYRYDSSTHGNKDSADLSGKMSFEFDLMQDNLDKVPVTFTEMNLVKSTSTKIQLGGSIGLNNVESALVNIVESH